MGSCILISILTQMHCLAALSRKQPEYHCHFGAILTNVYAAVRAYMDLKVMNFILVVLIWNCIICYLESFRTILLVLLI